MIKRRQFLLFLSTAMVLGVAGYAYHRAQVQSEAMQAAFAQFDVRFRVYNAKMDSQAGAAVRQIGLAVRGNRNMAKDVQVLNQSRQLRVRTRQMTDTLRAARRWWPRAGTVGISWLRRGTDASTARLKKQLLEYEAYIRKFVPEARLLTVPPFEKSPSFHTEFGDFYFNDVSSSATLATFSRLEAQVLCYEASAQGQHSSRVGYPHMICGKIGAFVAPEAIMILPGTIYQAKMGLGATNGAYQATMSVNGRPVPVEPGSGRGKVEFYIPAQLPGQPDTLRMHWQGIIKGPTATGGHTTLRLTVPYLVVKHQ